MKHYRTILGVIGAALLALVIAVAGRTFLLDDGAPAPGTAGMPQIGGPFTLVGAQGPVTDRDFQGQYRLMFFGYTYCPDVCPTALSTMASAMDMLPPEIERRITPVFVSVDHERDTPEMLADYVANFHPRAVGLTGTEEQVKDAAKKFRVYYAKAEQKDGPYLMDHSSIVYLMGPDGRFVTHFSHTTTPEQMAETLRKYVEPAAS